jgi:hypothetical protein
MITARDLNRFMRTLHPRPVRLRVRDISLPGYRTQFLMVLPQAAATNHDAAWLAEYLTRHLGEPVLVRRSRTINRRDCGHDTEWVIALAAWEREIPALCDCHAPAQRHDRWVVRNDEGVVVRQITDFAIRSYGRKHIERVVANVSMPPLPEDAWVVLA